MKSSALLLALLLLTACASDGFVDEVVSNCESGQAISIAAGILPVTETDRMSGNLTLAVEVSNNSNADITVKLVRFEPSAMSPEAMYEIENVNREFDKTIAEGESYAFELSVSARSRRRAMGPGMPSSIDGVVTVGLTGGELYRCRFRLPVRY